MTKPPQSLARHAGVSRCQIWQRPPVGRERSRPGNPTAARPTWYRAESPAIGIDSNRQAPISRSVNWRNCVSGRGPHPTSRASRCTGAFAVSRCGDAAVAVRKIAQDPVRGVVVDVVGPADLDCQDHPERHQDLRAGDDAGRSVDRQRRAVLLGVVGRRDVLPDSERRSDCQSQRLGIHVGRALIAGSSRKGVSGMPPAGSSGGGISVSMLCRCWTYDQGVRGRSTGLPSRNTSSRS